jgi:hypothetical protein
MTRTTLITVALAFSLLTPSMPALAQDTPAAPAASSDWFDAKVTLQLLGRDDVDSSTFEEYRGAQGRPMPVFNLTGSQGTESPVGRQCAARSATGAAGQLAVTFD